MKSWSLLASACMSVSLCACASVAVSSAVPCAGSTSPARAVAAEAPAGAVNAEAPAGLVIAAAPSATPPAPVYQPRAAHFRFDGIDDEYAVNIASLPLGSQPRTLTAWFRTTAGEGAHVIANWGTPNVGQRFGLLVDAGRVKLVGESQDIMTTHTFSDGSWHHAAATFDGSYAVVYIDGKPEVSGHLRLDTRGDRFVVGNAPIAHGPEFWRGEIDSVAVYPRALGSEEIAQLARL